MLAPWAEVCSRVANTASRSFAASTSRLGWGRSAGSGSSSGPTTSVNHGSSRSRSHHVAAVGMTLSDSAEPSEHTSSRPRSLRKSAVLQLGPTSTSGCVDRPTTSVETLPNNAARRPPLPRVAMQSIPSGSVAAIASITSAGSPLPTTRVSMSTTWEYSDARSSSSCWAASMSSGAKLTSRTRACSRRAASEHAGRIARSANTEPSSGTTIVVMVLLAPSDSAICWRSSQ